MPRLAVMIAVVSSACGELSLSDARHSAVAVLTQAPVPVNSSEAIAETVSWKMRALRAVVEGCNPNRSVGKPWRGHLKCGRLLPAHTRIQPMSLDQFGTELSNRAILEAADHLDTHDPNGPMIQVFDLSRVEGGRSPYHISHQSGRDVDYAYFYEEGFEPPRVFMDVPLELIDLERTWLLMEGLIDSNRVQLMLVDYELQGLLYEHAKERGSAKLERVFQWPRGPNKKVGLLRHYRNHANHFHVRFKCPKGHPRCRG